MPKPFCSKIERKELWTSQIRDWRCKRSGFVESRPIPRSVSARTPLKWIGMFNVGVEFALTVQGVTSWKFSYLIWRRLRNLWETNLTKQRKKDFVFRYEVEINIIGHARWQNPLTESHSHRWIFCIKFPQELFGIETSVYISRFRIQYPINQRTDCWSVSDSCQLGTRWLT